MRLTDEQIKIMRVWSNDNDDQRRVQRAVEVAESWRRAAPFEEATDAKAD